LIEIIFQYPVHFGQQITVDGFSCNELPLVKTIAVVEKYFDIRDNHILTDFINGRIQLIADTIQSPVTIVFS
jgi:3-polyprenyl-4-hydroxybenzoate decarboxylase